MKKEASFVAITFYQAIPDIPLMKQSRYPHHDEQSLNNHS
jgi:hypothetical protein